MKSFKYNQQTIYYKVYRSSDYDDIEIFTNLFLLDKPKYRKKYFLFGSVAAMPQYKKLGRLDYNIEDTSAKKEIIRQDIAQLFLIQEREQEIKKGEIL